MESYLIACHKCTKHAIEAVVVKLIRGELKDMPKAWAPSPAELSTAIRDEMEAVQRQVDLAAERQMIEDNRLVALPTLKLLDRIDAAKARMQAEGRKFLFECESFSAGTSSKGKVPPGSTYVGILGAWYGPPGSLYAPEPQPIPDDEMQEILRADMFEPDPVAEEQPLPSPEPEFQDVEF